MDEYGIIERRMKAYELPGAVSELVDWYLFHSDGAPGYCTRRTKVANMGAEEFEQLVARYKVEKDL